MHAGMADLLAEKTEKLQHLQLRMMLAARLTTLDIALRELTALEDALSRFASDYFGAVGTYATTLAGLMDPREIHGLNDMGVLLHDAIHTRRSARKKRLKTSYRKLALKFHPDTNADTAHAAHMMQRINAAYAASDVATLARLEIEHLEYAAGTAEILAEKMARCEALIGACAAEYALLEASPMFALHERTMLARLAGEDFIGRVVLGLKAQILKHHGPTKTPQVA